MLKTGDSEPLKETYTKNLFFAGLKGNNKTARMIGAYAF
jgi:hypothetical protein